MSAEITRRGIVWDTIERLAFMPNDPVRWLTVYERTLCRLWEVQYADLRIRIRTGFDVNFLNLDCNYQINAFYKYSVKITNVAATTSACWCIDADSTYCSKATFHPASGKYRSRDRAKYLSDDVRYVLDGMLFHPRTHAHGDTLGIRADMLTLDSHEIRLGGGIENAFVFLTHLRYQFCLLGDKARDQEKSRLVNLFMDAINNGERAISPKMLFDFRPEDDVTR